MVKAVTQDQREFVYRLSLGLSRSTVDELDGSIHSFIAELGDRLDADRSYLIMFDEATRPFPSRMKPAEVALYPREMQFRTYRWPVFPG